MGNKCFNGRRKVRKVYFNDLPLSPTPTPTSTSSSTPPISSKFAGPSSSLQSASTSGARGDDEEDQRSLLDYQLTPVPKDSTPSATQEDRRKWLQDDDEDDPKTVYTQTIGKKSTPLTTRRTSVLAAPVLAAPVLAAPVLAAPVLAAPVLAAPVEAPKPRKSTGKKKIKRIVKKRKKKVLVTTESVIRFNTFGSPGSHNDRMMSIHDPKLATLVTFQNRQYCGKDMPCTFLNHYPGYF